MSAETTNTDQREHHSDLPLGSEAIQLLEDVQHEIGHSTHLHGISEIAASIERFGNQNIQAAKVQDGSLNQYRDTAYQDRYQDTAYDDHYKDNVGYRDAAK